MTTAEDENVKKKSEDQSRNRWHLIGLLHRNQCSQNVSGKQCSAISSQWYCMNKSFTSALGTFGEAYSKRQCIQTPGKQHYNTPHRFSRDCLLSTSSSTCTTHYEVCSVCEEACISHAGTFTQVLCTEEKNTN